MYPSRKSETAAATHPAMATSFRSYAMARPRSGEERILQEVIRFGRVQTRVLRNLSLSISEMPPSS